jgi:ankyrin repeat protein
VVKRFDDMVALSRQLRGTDLLAQLAKVREQDWYLKALRPDQRKRYEVDQELWVAAFEGEDATVKRLLKAGGNADWLNLHKSEMLTPLLAAAARGHTKAVRLLLKTGDPGERTLSGRTALHLACAGGRLAMVRALVKAGADPEAKDAEGNTCREAASGHSKIERFLGRRR